MKKVSKKTRFFSVILLTGTTAIGLEASAPVYKPKITSVPGLPTQQQYDAAFDALGSVINVGMVSFGGSTTSPKTTKFPNLSESNLLAIRRDNLGIGNGDVFKTLEACRQQITQDDSKKEEVRFLCGKYEIKQVTNVGLRAYPRSVPFFSPNGPAKSVPFNFPLAGGITSSNAIDVAKNNHTLVDFFTKNAGTLTTKYALGGMSNIDPDTKAKNPKEKFTLLPENFMRFVFYPHQGLRAELMAHFIAPFAMGNDWDKWKEWGKKFSLVTENTEEMKTLMRQTLINLVEKDNPQAILDLFFSLTRTYSPDPSFRHVMETPSTVRDQIIEIIWNWWGENGRRDRLIQIADSTGQINYSRCWDNEEISGHYNPNAKQKVGAIEYNICDGTRKDGIGLEGHEANFLRTLESESGEKVTWGALVMSKAVEIWNFAVDDARLKAEQAGWKAKENQLKRRAWSALIKLNLVMEPSKIPTAVFSTPLK